MLHVALETALCACPSWDDPCVQGWGDAVCLLCMEPQMMEPFVYSQVRARRARARRAQAKHTAQSVSQGAVTLVCFPWAVRGSNHIAAVSVPEQQTHSERSAQEVRIV
jgi:hypothetical protein